MEIVRDEPGRSLVAEETTPRMPLGLFAGGLVLVVLVATPWRGLWDVVAHGSAIWSLDLAGSALWLGIGLLVVMSLRGGSRIERIAADRESGIVVRSTHVAGFVGWTRRIAAGDLRGFTLDVAPSATGRGRRRDRGRAHALPLRLTLRTARGRGRRIPLEVSKIDSTSEVADLALRVGAAVGLPYYRIVGSDAEQFEIELLRTPEPDARTVPALGGPADYARDLVAEPAKAAAADKPRRFDPQAFEGKPRVETWVPRQLVRFEKPWGTSLLLSPLLAASLAGPGAWWRLPSLHAMPTLPRIAALALITLIGLAVALIGWTALSMALPRRVTFDWSARSLVVEGALATRTVAFSDVEGIELRARSFRSRRGNRQYTTYYRCEVRAILGASAGAPTNLLVTETRQHREDRVTPHVVALPLARDLAAALDLELRETS